MSLCGEDFSVYSGDDGIAMELMLAGAQGNISVTANIAPAAMHALCELAMKGMVNEANAANHKLAQLHKNLFLESNPIPVKWAMHEMGLIDRGIRLPLVELDEQFHGLLREAMRMADVI